MASIWSFLGVGQALGHPRNVESFELLSFLYFLCVRSFLSNLQMHGTHGEDGVKWVGVTFTIAFIWH